MAEAASRINANDLCKPEFLLKVLRRISNPVTSNGVGNCQDDISSSCGSKTRSCHKRRWLRSGTLILSRGSFRSPPRFTPPLSPCLPWSSPTTWSLISFGTITTPLPGIYSTKPSLSRPSLPSSPLDVWNFERQGKNLI